MRICGYADKGKGILYLILEFPERNRIGGFKALRL
jgi:hypothetical protein